MRNWNAAFSMARILRAVVRDIITGPTGVANSHLGRALAHQACREGFRALYLRAPRLFDELAMAKADEVYRKIFATCARLDLLVVDD